jgi:addiction module HigA family antidote
MVTGLSGQSDRREDFGFNRNDQSSVARIIGFPLRMINRFVCGKRRVTAGTAARLSLFFGNSATAWFVLQMNYGLDTVIDRVGDVIQMEVTPLREAG